MKFLAQCGAVPVAVAASDFGRSRFHAERLAALYNIQCRPYASVTEMLVGENLDALAICTPPEGHAEQLNLALDRGIHVFCEKPLIWKRNKDTTATANVLVKSFYEKNLVLHCNTQWTYTLADFERLHGPIEHAVVEKFEIQLSPAMKDTESMIREAVPHANSLLLALGATGKPWNLEFAEHEVNGAPKQWEARFSIRAKSGQTISARYRFTQCREQPRPAAYAINGREARREITLQGYRQYFCAGARRVAICDPLKTSVMEFLEKIRICRSGGGVLFNSAAAENMRLLGYLYLSQCYE
ncbi:MAG: Gfo/Idh/MocA family oxidoreductase [Alphaproteobacteria bacterium]